ncbi:hypothetical protein [Alkalimarinus alittae]|uniref:Uncharacterized protein n=1 Tax=Alkalimarinus alittae TaxID=2961619 RepID=A0ABY6N0D0_9ALTE|nr:hypothetical protein [Alkalimarinus alittae]UZE95485.1 hypothetical protein NKI27_15625 [Alkalimarinus alittae]
MLKQMRQWQNALTLTLVLICVGIGLSHNIEAALALDHGEHCSICISGNTPPVTISDATLVNTAINCAVFETSRPTPAYPIALWPDYSSRAPPLV